MQREKIKQTRSIKTTILFEYLAKLPPKIDKLCAENGTERGNCRNAKIEKNILLRNKKNGKIDKIQCVKRGI